MMRDTGLSARTYVRSIAASSIASFARRSASLFSSRRTCSNVTVPIRAQQGARLLEEWHETGTLHAVLAAHLLHQQLRIGSDVQPAHPVIDGPRERRQQPPILRDVVRADADRFLEVHLRAVVPLDANAVAGGTRIAAGAAVDVRHGGRLAVGTEKRRLRWIHDVRTTGASTGGGGGT